ADAIDRGGRRLRAALCRGRRTAGSKGGGLHFPYLWSPFCGHPLCSERGRDSAPRSPYLPPVTFAQLGIPSRFVAILKRHEAPCAGRGLLLGRADVVGARGPLDDADPPRGVPRHGAI